MSETTASDTPSSAKVECSEIHVARMDCMSEERTVRLTLEGSPGVTRLAFDLPTRRLSVWHSAGAAPSVLERLERLGLGAQLVETRSETSSDQGPASAEEEGERRTLWILLAINGCMFVAEGAAGRLVQSTGLLADSLDMLADAFVYGLSLYSVGKAVRHKLVAAKSSGYLQVVLAVAALSEVARRFVGHSEPEPLWMLGVATVALIANVSCLVLVARHRKGGAHMKASYIFSTNDVIANLGVIAAGVIVALTGSRYPDLVVGALIAFVVLTGAVRILRLKE